MRSSLAANAAVAVAAVVAVVAVVAVGAGCQDPAAVVVVIDGDLQVPDELDAVCLAVADAAPEGGAFGRHYRLEAVALPQTLVVEPGAASSGVATARGFRAGLEVARDRRAFDFGSGLSDLGLSLDACAPGDAITPTVAGSVAAPVGARAAVSLGRGGTRIVVVGAGAGFVAAVESGGQGLVDTGAALPTDAADLSVLDVAPIDIDGDCDDDLVVLVEDQPPRVWRRDGSDFVDAGVTLDGLPTAVAAVGVDVDGDGDMDLVAGGDVLRLYRNDGAGRFAVDPEGIAVTAASDVTALAAADVDGDGAVDLIVGQGADVPAIDVVLLNDAAGRGAFTPAPAALPAIATRTAALAAGDIDGDGRADLLVAAADGSLRAYVNGGGQFEDQTATALPADPGAARTLASREWDGDCVADALAVVDGAVVGLVSRGGPGLQAEALPPVAAERVILADVDDDGTVDGLAVGGTGGLVWLRR